MKLLSPALSVVAAMMVGAASAACAAELQSQLDVIRSVEGDGQDARQAAEAWKQLAASQPEQLPQILAALDGAGPLAANWLRAAVDAVAERALNQGQALPDGQLEQFVLDTQHDPRARRLAYEWLARVDAAAPERLIPRMLHDASVELRRDAVARLLEQADQLYDEKQRSEAREVYQQALAGARDEDQVKWIAQRLKSLGAEVNLPRHFGFLMHWQVIGPFDNTDRNGFEAVYPPEQEIDLTAEYQGKSGPVRWQLYTTQHDFGMVDLNEPLGSLKEVVGYARTVFTSDRTQPVELRLGCKNAWKVWLNGELLFGRDEYHRGMRMDQYRLHGTLQPGDNEILVKLCQNEQMETWTVEWQFQLRVCDATGTAILSTTRGG